jgi:hypothetical protein
MLQCTFIKYVRAKLTLLRSAQTCLVKAAECRAIDKDYETASSIFESATEKALKNTRLSATAAHIAKEYMLKSAICALAFDLVFAKKLLERWTFSDGGISASREFRFVDSLVKSVEENDEDKFTQTCGEYESFIDGIWKPTALLVVKKEHFNNLE